jgi:hypothetical protein
MRSLNFTPRQQVWRLRHAALPDSHGAAVGMAMTAVAARRPALALLVAGAAVGYGIRARLVVPPGELIICGASRNLGVRQGIAATRHRFRTEVREAAKRSTRRRVIAGDHIRGEAPVRPGRRGRSLVAEALARRQTARR